MSADKPIKTDVHLHTCLSPCADITQSPKRIIEKLSEKEFGLVFITDHNSMANAEAVIKSGKDFGDLRIYPGMEITTREEIHILSLFENLHNAGRTQEYINNYLPDVYFKTEMQEQIIANENDEVEGFYDKSLFSAVDLDLDEVIELIHDNKGIVIAAHIDRQCFSILSQLGFIPDKCELDALEISPNMSLQEAMEIYNKYSLKYKFVKGSDSHSLHTIGCSFTEFYGKDNSFNSFYNFINE
jgi:3',5'-nucleoside bisphosphate phosphatase